MKKIISLVLLLITSISIGQEKKYQSLLWEISGNGLQKKSYMYGSMHVSDKISYHLSDAFFQHLRSADIIANESEPRSWTSLFDVFNTSANRFNNRPFYSNFYLTPLEKPDLFSLFRNNNYNLISILSRTNEFNKEYQEETYLDMFIYRTGRKYNKKTVGLEDIKKSTINIMKAQMNMDYSEVDKNRQKLIKILKNKNINQALMDAYREKDLDRIDTLTQLSGTSDYLKAMLFDRNIEMVKNMDSIMKTGSLFSAIGAAHLPGKKGVIELLRKKGYTVKPIFDAYTEKGKKGKKEIETYFNKPQTSMKTSEDGVISIPLFDVVLENQENFESPDLVNGGYINVKRTLLNDFFKKDNATFNPKTLDSLFYENIPGEILEKKAYNEKNYFVYDIKNKTKTGNAQRYRYYITPLEIIAVLMGGEGNYVRLYEDEIFNKITIKTGNENWQTIQPHQLHFEVKVPGYYTYQGNKKDDRNNKDITLVALDQSQKAHFFLIEKSLHELNLLENSEYELKRIHQEFYNQHELDSSGTHWNKDKTRFASEALFENKKVKLLSTMNGNKYYLLGALNASVPDSKMFFDSFKITDSKPTLANKAFKDEAANFAIQIPSKENEYLDFMFERNRDIGEKKVNYFDVKPKEYYFYDANNHQVALEFIPKHKYESLKNMDSVWVNLRKVITKNDTYLNEFKIDETIVEVPAVIGFEKNNEENQYFQTNWDTLFFDPNKEPKLVINSEKITFDAAKNCHIYEALVTKEDANQAIKHKMVFNNGAIYKLQTLVPKSYKGESEFIEKAFNSFEILNPDKQNTIFDSKLDLFLSDVRSKHDSIRYSALNSYPYLELQDTDFTKFKTFLNSFKFKDDETEILGSLYGKLGALKTPEVLNYLDKLYRNNEVNTILQFAILKALINQKSKEGYAKILELMEYDLPISNNEFEVDALFQQFHSDLENSQVLFPGIFQFYSIKEYHQPIISFSERVIASNLSNPKKLKVYKKMILTNAKIELKRIISWQNEQKTKDKEQYDYYNYEEEAPIADFMIYATLLSSFKKDKAINQLFEKAFALNNDDLDVALAELELEETNSVQPKLLQKIIANEKVQFLGYLMQYKMKQAEAYKSLDAKDLAKAALVYSEEIDSKKDSLAFYTTKEVQFKGKKIVYYFFKYTNIDPDSTDPEKEKIMGFAFVFEGKSFEIKNYYRLETHSYIEEKELNGIMNGMIDYSLNSNYERAAIGKVTGNGRFYGGFDGEYIED